MLEIRLFLAVLYYSGSKRAKIPYIHYNFSRVCPQPSWDREKVYYFAMQLHTKCSLSKNTLGVDMIPLLAMYQINLPVLFFTVELPLTLQQNNIMSIYKHKPYMLKSMQNKLR